MGYYTLPYLGAVHKVRSAFFKKFGRKRTVGREGCQLERTFELKKLRKKERNLSFLCVIFFIVKVDMQNLIFDNISKIKQTISQKSIDKIDLYISYIFILK